MHAQLLESGKLERTLRLLDERSSVGLPSGSGGPMGSGYSDRTGSTAARAVDKGQSCSPERDLKLAIKARLSNMLADILDLSRICDAELNEWQRDVKAGCELCDQARDEDDRPHRRGYQPTFTGPRCEFHHDFWVRYDEDAHPAITWFHLDNPGRRVPTPMVKQFHSDAYSARHGEKSA